MTSVNTNALFRTQWLSWSAVGAVPNIRSKKPIYWIYALLVTWLANIFYPVHLGVMLFRNDNLGDDIKNLALFVTVTACSIKFILYASSMPKIFKMADIFNTLDARISTKEDRKFFMNARKPANNIVYAYSSLYTMILISAEVSFLFRSDRSLLYPAWFPFNWQTSTFQFYICNAFQVVGISYQLMQNYVSDSLPALSLYLLSMHIRLLGRRVSRIGYDCEDLKENEDELGRCIIDQKNLYELFNTIQQFTSKPMFIQLAVTAFNICVAMASLIFFADSMAERIYYLGYFLAMPLQTFPTCYYGSEVQVLFGKLQYDIFSCNWVYQTQRFRKHLILFSERSLNQVTALAGGMVPIHLDTFFATCKGAYSLFAVILKIKN